MIQIITEEELQNATDQAKMKIKLKHPGAFTEYCGGKVTCECIYKALTSDDTTLHRRANFAYNFGFKRNGHICPQVEKLREQSK